MAELRKHARDIMLDWTQEELVHEVVDAGLMSEEQAKILNKSQLSEYLERDMSDPEIVEFIESSASESRQA